ncbi:hypothetical protein C671_1231 [[Clostridium] bifermentans ATCC 19299]|nr:hypothetical protein C671_1231 [[Clostridium] bifermentans ATCC 19299] [Paraclostridium bifermentans ATCC 19299]
MFKIVDLPLPEGPSRVRISPSFKEKLMSFKTWISPSLL